MYRQWIKSFIDPHWEAIGRTDYARRRCLSFGTNSREARGGGGWRAVGVAWSFVKGVDTTRGGGRGGPRLEASLQASSLIHTSAPLVSSLVSGTESWRTLSSHDFERFGEEMELLNETWKLFSLPLPPLFVIRWIKVRRSSEDWDKKFSLVKMQRNIYFITSAVYSLSFFFSLKVWEKMLKFF